MEIFKAGKEDLDEIVSLNKQFHLDIPDFKWDTPEWISKEIQKGNYYVLVENNFVHGALCLKTPKQKQNFLTEKYEIVTIAIKKNKQKQGLGKKLLNFAKEESRKAGKHELVIESFCEYGLTDFYLKCGFQLEDELGEYKGHKFFRFRTSLH